MKVPSGVAYSDQLLAYPEWLEAAREVSNLVISQWPTEVILDLSDDEKSDQLDTEAEWNASFSSSNLQVIASTGAVMLAYSHLGIGSAPVVGCHDQSGGKLRAYNEPRAVVGTTKVGGATSLFHVTGQGVWRLDLGAAPLANKATVRIAQSAPTGTTIAHNLKASNTGAFAGEETDLGAVVDGTTFTGAYRHFSLTTTFTSNTQRDKSPIIEHFSILYPRGYPASGETDLYLDVEFTPERSGEWEIDSIVPSGTTLTLTAEASNREDFDRDVVNIGAIADGGAILERKRFYRVHLIMTTDADAIKTPRLTRIKANFPNG